MAFDQPTRNRLQRFVNESRKVLEEEFTRQLQNDYGLDPVSGTVTDMDKLRDLNDAQRETARILRDTLAHYRASQQADARTGLDRIVREQAFTVLNRLAALRLAEARGLLVESVGNGYQAKGFQLYARLAGTGLGETGDAYRVYLFSVFDELAQDLPTLFDRYAPQGRLFPREAALLQVLPLINHAEIEPLWAEDETIGWIYQYFNSTEERKKMRKDSAAPRNSRELAVRNQFFTPRYVVEFLTDNTLGRIWYEMCQGNTRLKDTCQYLVRRPNEVFLAKSTVDEKYDREVKTLADALRQGRIPDWPAEERAQGDLAIQLGHCVDAYQRDGEPAKHRHLEEQYRALDDLTAVPLQELWDFLFLCARADRQSGCGTIFRRGSLAMGAAQEILERLRAGEGEEHAQEELLRAPVLVPYRPRKDPREIRLLDPACGSMHFGLYAFDLFEAIYEEAWDSGDSSVLQEAYANKENFLMDVPRLIIEHNIHGIDIDPRAVQIAGLSLWLRAQRAWKDQGVKPADRPRIRRSNIVCAEPMPGSPEMLEDFVATLDPPLLGELVRTVFDRMKLAGEAGALLKIEEEIRTAIEDARRAWEEFESRPLELFTTEELNQTRRPGAQQEPTGLDRVLAKGRGPMTTDFWDTAENQVIDALRGYAEHAETDAYQRRLFADDAARGFAFIDLCRKRYDAVVMNPPFGEASSESYKYIDDRYQDWNKNVLCAFFDRAVNLNTSLGSVGAIYDRTAVIKSTYENFRRRHIVPDNRLRSVADLGWEVLDANVEVTSSILSRVTGPGVFIDVRSAKSDCKGQEILAALKAVECGLHEPRVTVENASRFKRFPNAVIGYDFPGFLRVAFSEFHSLGEQGLSAFQGHALKSEKHFRLWWECYPGSSEVRARLFNGSGFSPYKTRQLATVVAPVPLELIPKDSSTVLRNPTKHFKRGVCFGKRGEFFAAHVLPDGFVFTVEGQSFPIPSKEQALALLGFLNTPLVRYSLNRFCGQHKYSGYVNLLPHIQLENESEIAKYVEETINKHAFAESLDELSPIFGNARPSCESLSDALRLIDFHVQSACEGSRVTERFCSDLYEDGFSLTGEERRVLDEFSAKQPVPELPISDVSGARDLGWFVGQSFCSNALGTVLGRWDIRYATGERQRPALPDPFDPLPVCPPGMLQNAEGLPAEPEDVPANYPLRISWPGILVDDKMHPEDIVARVRDAMEVIWKDRAESIEQEACEFLGVKTLRDYFRRPATFFADHLSRYSKSRRQAPIYWPLSTPSNSYSLWIYYHRLTDQTLYTAVNDFVEPKLKQVADEMAHLQSKAQRASTEEKDLERLSDLEVELREFQDELLRIARFWKPNLNDGVLITAAPLWRLFQHKPWQKKLKETWETLEGGGYDWAHLALSIWPDRVVRASHKDRSYAIAHDLEAALWEEAEVTKKTKSGKATSKVEWCPRKLTEAELSAIVAEVKAR